MFWKRHKTLTYSNRFWIHPILWSILSLHFLLLVFFKYWYFFNWNFFYCSKFLTFSLPKSSFCIVDVQLLENVNKWLFLILNKKEMFAVFINLCYECWACIINVVYYFNLILLASTFANKAHRIKFYGELVSKCCFKWISGRYFK